MPFIKWHKNKYFKTNFKNSNLNSSKINKWKKKGGGGGGRKCVVSKFLNLYFYGLSEILELLSFKLCTAHMQ